MITQKPEDAAMDNNVNLEDWATFKKRTDKRVKQLLRDNGVTGRQARKALLRARRLAKEQEVG